MCICRAFRSSGVYGVEYWTKLGRSVVVEGILDWWRKYTLWLNMLIGILLLFMFFLYFFVSSFSEMHKVTEKLQLHFWRHEAQINYSHVILWKEGYCSGEQDHFYPINCTLPWLRMKRLPSQKVKTSLEKKGKSLLLLDNKSHIKSTTLVCNHICIFKEELTPYCMQNIWYPFGWDGSYFSIQLNDILFGQSYFIFNQQNLR